MTWTKAPRRRTILFLSAVLVAAVTAAMAIEVRRANPGPGETLLQPQAGFTYALERDGILAGYFAECEGLGSETEVVEFREGGEMDPVRKLPGRHKYSDVTLKRGITSDLMVWNWREDVIAGEDGFRSQLRIRMLNREGSDVAVWTLGGGWPIKVSGPQLNADGNDIAIESIVIAHEGMHRVR